MAAGLRALLSRGALVLFGVFLSLLVLEAALRVGALFVGRGLADQSTWLGKRRVLCLGDSNTYGLYVDKTQAYPKVFESVWNAQSGNASQTVEVLNLGFPSTNSSKLVKDFRRMLQTFHPNVVTVMIGANDLWTMPETAAESPNRLDRLSSALWRVSRAYRFLYMMRRAVQVRRIDAASDTRQLVVIADPPAGFEHGHGIARYGADEFELGWTRIPEGGLPGWRPDVELEKNLATLAEQAADYGAKLIFLTYAADSLAYSWANRVIRDTAKATDTPLIDVAAVLKPSCPVPAGSSVFDGRGAECPELFPDQHPTVLGHEKVAHILAQQLLPALEQTR